MIWPGGTEGDLKNLIETRPRGASFFLNQSSRKNNI